MALEPEREELFVKKSIYRNKLVSSLEAKEAAERALEDSRAAWVAEKAELEEKQSRKRRKLKHETIDEVCGERIVP